MKWNLLRRNIKEKLLSLGFPHGQNSIYIYIYILPVLLVVRDLCSGNRNKKRSFYKNKISMYHSQRILRQVCFNATIEKLSQLRRLHSGYYNAASVFFSECDELTPPVSSRNCILQFPGAFSFRSSIFDVSFGLLNLKVYTLRIILMRCKVWSS